MCRSFEHLTALTWGKVLTRLIALEPGQNNKQEGQASGRKPEPAGPP